jgi:hypothetical protein
MTDAAPDRPAAPRLRVEIFLLSLAMILLEIGYTRIFSFKLVYYFTYVVIGIALLGLGSGGVLVATVRALGRPTATRLVAFAGLVASIATMAGYLLVARVQVNAIDLVAALDKGDAAAATAEGAHLLLVVAALFGPFLVGGVAVARILAAAPEAAGRLYAADLAGAAFGAAIAVPLMTAWTPPGMVFLSAALFGGAGIAAARRAGATLRSGLAAVTLAALAGTLVPGRLPDVVPDRVKSMSPDKAPRTIFSRWSPVFRVDVLADLGLRGASTAQRMINHDGMWGSVLTQWDGTPDGLKPYAGQARSYPFRVLPPKPRVAIIGSAGGHEILTSLAWNAAHVTGVELNPVTISLLTRHFRNFTGRLDAVPEVSLVNAEGRTYLARHPGEYDLVWFVAPDSYAAMNAATAGAYVLSESYLYTAEMVIDALHALAPGGIVCTQFGEGRFERKPNRTARYLVTVREGLRRLGIADPSRHVLVATTPGFVFTTATILVKATPFSDDEVARFADAVASDAGSRVRYSWREPEGPNPATTVMRLDADDLRRWLHDYPFDLSPVTDDAPFFWHFVRFRDAFRAAEPTTSAVVFEDGLGERLLGVLLVVVTLFGATFLLAPLAFRRATWAAMPWKGHAALYFAALGAGFMFLEVTLIQRFTLFLGYPTYSLTVTLCVLLLSTGVGSALSGRSGLGHRGALAARGVLLAVLVAVYQLVLPALLQRGLGWPLAARVAVTALALAPLGVCLGTFMPLGLRTVATLSPEREAYVAWAWAVNGFASVVSSVLATILAMTIGFRAVMLVALAVYGIGLAAFARIPAVRGAPAD